MRIALMQYPIVWEDKEENLRRTHQRLATLAGKADVALLPEMFSTGFCTNRPELAEEENGKTIQLLQDWSKEYEIAIAGSYIARENGHLYNRGFFVRPNGDIDFADKRHLYAHGGEAMFFHRGEKRVISEYKGVKFLLLVCYDLRFPVWSRNQNGDDYDILLYCANWPDVRIQYWDALLPARATENQCAVCGVNCVGDDGNGLHYSGHSIAYDTYLRPLTDFEENESGIRIADIDVDAIHHFRERLPLWKDVDRFTLAGE